jgi:glycogen synthase
MRLRQGGGGISVLMLGWEFPPFISGGLGTACYGLTKALDEVGIRITFILPRMVESEYLRPVLDCLLRTIKSAS